MLEVLLRKKISVVWGGAEYPGFDKILSTIIVYLLFILSNINIYVSNITLLLLLFVAVWVIVIFNPETVSGC